MNKFFKKQHVYNTTNSKTKAVELLLEASSPRTAWVPNTKNGGFVGKYEDRSGLFTIIIDKVLI